MKYIKNNNSHIGIIQKERIENMSLMIDIGSIINFGFEVIINNPIKTAIIVIGVGWLHEKINF